jgi:uncharacterized membrane protein
MVMQRVLTREDKREEQRKWRGKRRRRKTTTSRRKSRLRKRRVSDYEGCEDEDMLEEDEETVEEMTEKITRVATRVLTQLLVVVLFILSLACATIFFARVSYRSKSSRAIKDHITTILKRILCSGI